MAFVKGKMEIFKFCEIAQMKNLKEKMHWAVFRAIPHKERLATLHAICLQIFRHISQKCS